MNTPIILTFIGPVGVGKTTQMRLLSKYFESKNRKTVKTYIKSAHGLSYLLLIFFKIVGISKKVVGIDDLVSYRPSRKFRKRITPLWNLTETISIIGKFFFTVYLPYILGYDVIIEEGLRMSIEHHKYFTPHFIGVEPAQPLLLEVLLNWICSRRHLDIILDAEEHEIVERRRSRSFRTIESEKFVELQRRAMSKMKGPNLIHINTSGKSKLSVHNTIIEKIEKKLYLYG